MIKPGFVSWTLVCAHRSSSESNQTFYCASQYIQNYVKLRAIIEFLDYDKGLELLDSIYAMDMNLTAVLLKAAQFAVGCLMT